jgi:hypothetical protein
MPFSAEDASFSRSSQNAGCRNAERSPTMQLDQFPPAPRSAARTAFADFERSVHGASADRCDWCQVVPEMAAAPCDTPGSQRLALCSTT